VSGERDETLEDIATKIREGGFGELADHIEAALNAERERSREYWTKKCRDTIAEHDRYCGNSAALREALEHCRNCAQMIPQFVQGSRPERSSLDAVARYANAIVGEVKAALDKPARNCDKFKSLDEARKAFQILRGHKVWADVGLWDDRDEISAIFRWLFATATAQEGANDGDK